MAAHTLLFLHPAHFHAALTLRQRDPRVAERVHVYGEEGPDLRRFLALVESFNRRAESPTGWQVALHLEPHPLERLIAERRGEAVVLAGRNDLKATPLARLHAAGFAVLADKPLLLGRAELPLLRAALASAPPVLDIMTERHDTSWALCRRLVHDADVFGAWDTTGPGAAIAIENVHEIYKRVNGAVLQRPAWFFDAAVYGDGIVDIPSHLVDIVQWLLGGAPFDYARDVALGGARLWETPIALEDFRRITGLDAWPEELGGKVRGGVLPLPCNGALEYRLRGVPVRLESRWALSGEPREDWYRASLRGTRAEVAMEHAMARESGRRLTVSPRAPDIGPALERAVARMQEDFPGVTYSREGPGWALQVPPRLERAHEELFHRVLDGFLAALETGTWPADEAANVLCKYTLLAEASALATAASKS